MTPVGRAMFLVGVVRLRPQEGDRFPGRKEKHLYPWPGHRLNFMT